MAITNNTTNKLTNQELSIQISLSGLSFCILQRDLNTITTQKEISFAKKLNHLEILDQLINLFNTQIELQGPFSKVCVIHDNELATLVPKPLFKKESLADYLKFNSKILKSDYITYDKIALNNSVNVYIPYINVNNFIYEKFGDFTFKHVSTVLIESILQIEKHANTINLYVNVSADHFEIVTINNAKLLLYNTFEYSTKEDFIYYILFTAEQLGLNPETFNLVFVGNVSKGDKLYNIAYKYIRNISFYKPQNSFLYKEPPKNTHYNFTLIKSL